MAKLGPKLPPPTRRELARQEKELKRATQLANGLDPAQLGEPREHLALLLAKKSRSKRLETSALEHSWKRWEKNQKRAQARRLAKTLKENISAEGSQGYEDTSQSATSFDDDGQGNPKIPTIPGDSSEVRIPYLDSTASDTYGIPVGSHEYPLDSESGELSSMSLTGTSLSLSSSECPKIQESPSVSMLPYVSNTPRLGVDISTDDFWTDGNAVSSSSPDLTPRVKIPPIAQAQDNQPAGKSFDAPTLSSEAPPDAFSRVSSLRRLRNLMNAAMAPPRLSSRKGSASSSIFSEPLDLSKYSNKPSASAHGHGNSQRYESRGPGFLGSAVSSGHRLDNASNSGSSHGPNLTPRAGASSHLHPKSPDLSADQTVLTRSKGRIYGINGWDSNPVTWRPPAVHSSDARSGIGYTFGTIAAPESSAKHSSKETSDVLKDGVVSNKVPDHQMQLPISATVPKVSESARPLPAKEQILQEISNNAITRQPESQRNTDMNPGHNPILNQTVQQHDHFSSNVANVGASVETSDVNRSVIFHESAPVVQNDSCTAAVLAPAACIVQDKKSKVGQVDEVDEMEKGSRSNLFKIQPALKSMLRPAARENGNEQNVSTVKYPDTPPNSWSGIVPPASTPATRSPLIFAMGLPSPPWSRSNILPRHVSDTAAETSGTSRGFVSALKWVFRKTLGYFWQRR